ncbi:MAG: sulfate transporter CysZ [Legionellales bacterium]|nr:sulfate transporter CysZ [Legionellales bacterium]
MRTNMLNDLALGVKYFIKGFTLLSHRQLRPYVIIPLIINVLLFISMIFCAKHYFGSFVDWIDGYLPTWLHFINWLLWGIFISVFYLVIVYSFVIFANIIGSPFNSFLAEKTELLVKFNCKVEDGGWRDFIKDLPRTLRREVRKLLYYIPLLLIFLILFIIPVIHIFAGFLWFLFSAWMLAIQYIDYPFDNHKVAFAQMKVMLSQRRLLCLSFGSLSLLASLIPILNFVVMPASVIGATIMWQTEFS